VPIGISLTPQVTLGTNLVPENAIVPQIPATTTQKSEAVSTAASSTASLIQSLYAEVKALEAQIAALEATTTP
jgi:hypothetical protein